jgi:4-hydroxybenzoate polyprenyltransferase
MAVSVFFVTQERAALSKIISFIGVLSFSIHLFWQWQNFDAKNSQLLLTLFRSNRNAGLIFAVFLCFAILV